MGKKFVLLVQLEIDMDETDVEPSKNVTDMENRVAEWVMGDRYWLLNAIQKAINDGDEMVAARYKG